MTPVRGTGLGSVGLTGMPLATAAQSRSLQEQFEVVAAWAEALDRESRVALNNAAVFDRNAPIFLVLEQTTDALVDRDPAEWRMWWQDYTDTQKNKQTYYEYVPSRSYFSTTYQQQLVVGTSCFAAGTRVRTQTGLLPIEQITIGDRVLAQDTETGELAYKPVLQTTAAPPVGELMSIGVEGDPVHMTAGHVVWVTGRGWRMAKQLAPGDQVHGLQGTLGVDGTEQLPPVARVYNLVVADFNTYFVGPRGVLVHDITYRRPTRAIVPGLVEEQGSFALGTAPRNLHRQLRVAREEFGR